jgi:hypothetical protein
VRRTKIDKTMAQLRMLQYLRVRVNELPTDSDEVIAVAQAILEIRRELVSLPVIKREAVSA